MPITFAPAADPSPCSTVRVDVHGVRNATHLGRFESAEWYHCFDPARPLEFTDGRFTFEAADGSTIHGSYFGRFVPTSDPEVLSIDGHWTIAGGTGRFTGASGGGAATGTAGAAAHPWQPGAPQRDTRSVGAPPVRRFAVVASASGNGKTTLGRELARRLDVPFVELDALVHGPGWAETPDDELRALVEPILAGEGWVVDGSYRRKLGDLVLESADVVVWLDQPIRVWLPRLLRRTHRRIRGDEPLWNDNSESWRTALWGRESLVVWAFRMHFARRRRYPAQFRPYTVVRLRSPREVERWLAGVAK